MLLFCRIPALPSVDHLLYLQILILPAVQRTYRKKVKQQVFFRNARGQISTGWDNIIPHALMQAQQWPKKPPGCIMCVHMLVKEHQIPVNFRGNSSHLGAYRCKSHFSACINFCHAGRYKSSTVRYIPLFFSWQPFIYNIQSNFFLKLFEQHFIFLLTYSVLCK